MFKISFGSEELCLDQNIALLFNLSLWLSLDFSLDSFIVSLIFPRVQEFLRLHKLLPSLFSDLRPVIDPLLLNLFLDFLLVVLSPSLFSSDHVLHVLRSLGLIEGHCGRCLFLFEAAIVLVLMVLSHFLLWPFYNG